MKYLVGLAAIAAGLVGCASTPEPAAPPPAPVAAPAEDPAVQAFELRQRDRAQQAAQQGQWAVARSTLETLVTLRPGNGEYRERLAQAQRQIDAGVAARLPAAQAAQQRGELDTAARLYLEVLALSPTQPAAAEGLRATERERNRRAVVGRFARDVMARTPQAEPRAARSADAASTDTSPSAAHLEHATLLAAQGEWDSAVRLLNERLAAQPKDSASKSLLAELYAQQAERLAANDRNAAIKLLERSVKLDPGNPALAQRLRLLRGNAAPASR